MTKAGAFFLAELSAKSMLFNELFCGVLKEHYSKNNPKANYNVVHGLDIDITPERTLLKEQSESKLQPVEQAEPPDAT